MYGVQASALPPVICDDRNEVLSKFDLLLKDVAAHHFYPAAAMRQLLNKYNANDLELIYQDLIDLREITFAKATKKRDYLVTAGGPTAGKSTLLEAILDQVENPFFSEPERLRRAYIDPDRSCLFHMERTYKKDRETGKRDATASYLHWREASNFISNYFLAIALDQGYAIAHGSTMATEHAKKALNVIRDHYGYHVTILHLTCDDEIRAESEKNRRAQGIIQCTDNDFKEKQALFFTLLPDYVESADEIHICYRGKMDTVVWAAKISRGLVSYTNEEAFKHVRRLHDAAIGEGFTEKSLGL